MGFGWIHLDTNASDCRCWQRGNVSVVNRLGDLAVWTGKYNLKKSRRTDVEDLTPNPRKLLQIGNELRKLNKVISDLTPVSELPITARPRSRKEKNKLASRYWILTFSTSICSTLSSYSWVWHFDTLDEDEQKMSV